MILSTPEEFFRHMEETYPGAFPVHSGDSAGAWAGAVNCGTPVSQGWIRTAGDRILTAEELAAVNFMNGSDYPAGRIDSVYQDILAFDEHSGAGVGWPGLLTKEEIDRSNRIDFETAERAYSMSGSLLELTLGEFCGAIGVTSPAIIVFNPLSWARTDVVRITLPEAVYNLDFILRDGSTLEEIPYQKMEDSAIEFIAGDVPPAGYRVFYGEQVSEPPSYPDLVTVSGNGRILENEFYRISVSQDGLSIVDKEFDRELVNRDSNFFFNGLIRAFNQEDFFGIYHSLPTGPVTLGGSPGPVNGGLVLEFASSPLARTEIILYAGLNKIELINTLDRGRMRFVPYSRHSDHYSLTFPFALDIESDFAARVENPNVMIRPDTDYLQGAFVGNFVSQHAIDLREASGFGVTLANRESFMNEIGGVYHRNTNFQPEEATVVNRVVQKLDQGETSDQGIVTITSMDDGIEISRFHHAIVSSQMPADSLSLLVPVEAVRFGWSFDRPLEAAFVRGKARYHGGRADPEASFFQLSRDNVVLVAVKRSEFNGDSDLIFRIQEVGGTAAAGVAILSPFSFQSAELNTLVEEGIEGGTLPPDPITFDIGPHETVTIRAR